MYTFDVNGRITDPDANEGTTVDSIMAPNSMISSVVQYDYALDETDATSEETQYTYNGSSLTYASVGDDELYFAYDAAGAPLSVTYNGTDYYYVLNIQGDIIGIVDSTGTQVVAYTYDAWGKYSVHFWLYVCNSGQY